MNKKVENKLRGILSKNLYLIIIAYITLEMLLNYYPIPRIYSVLPNEILQAPVNLRGKVMIIFGCNTITKILGDESNYKIESKKDREGFGSNIEISYNVNNFIISFIDNSGKIIDVNFIPKSRGPERILIVDDKSQYYENYLERVSLPRIDTLDVEKVAAELYHLKMRIEKLENEKAAEN